MSKTVEVEYDVNAVIEALLFMFSRYQKTPEPLLRQAIVEHMAMLENHPGVNSESLRNTAGRLKKFWACSCDMHQREVFHAMKKPAGVTVH